MNQWKIGDVSIKRVVEIESLGGSKVILPDATREVCKPFNRMRPHFLEDFGAQATTVKVSTTYKYPPAW